MKRRKLSTVFAEALEAALAATHAGGREQTAMVNKLRRLWRECEQTGFPLRDVNVADAAHLIRNLDLRRGNPSSVLRYDIVPTLETLRCCALWAEEVSHD